MRFKSAMCSILGLPTLCLFGTSAQAEPNQGVDASDEHGLRYVDMPDPDARWSASFGSAFASSRSTLLVAATTSGLV